MRFATMARWLGAECRAAGLTVPAFRSPPRIEGASRTIRRLGDGVVVAVRINGRTGAEVATDMIEGIVWANNLRPAEAKTVRDRLAVVVVSAWEDPGSSPGTNGARSSRNLAGKARMAERQTQAA